MKYNKIMLLLALLPSLQLYSSASNNDSFWASFSAPKAHLYKSDDYFDAREYHFDTPTQEDNIEPQDHRTYKKITNIKTRQNENQPMNNSHQPAGPVKMNISENTLESAIPATGKMYQDFFNKIEYFLKLKNMSYDNIRQEYKPEPKINSDLAYEIAKLALNLKYSSDQDFVESAKQDENKIKMIDPDFFDLIQLKKQEILRNK